MKKNKLAVPLKVSLIISILFLRQGISTAVQYAHSPTDSHFIAAVLGTAMFILVLIVSVLGLLTIAYPQYFRKWKLLKGISAEKTQADRQGG